MKRLYISLIAVFMLFAVANVYSQGKSDGKGQAHDMIYICHNGMVIMVNAASWPAHEAHGDQMAVQNAAGEWVCPEECPEPPTPEPRMVECSLNGTVVLVPGVWDPEVCDWVCPDIIDPNDDTGGGGH